MSGFLFDKLLVSKKGLASGYDILKPNEDIFLVFNCSINQYHMQNLPNYPKFVTRGY